MSLFNETLLTFREAAAMLPSRPNVSTLHRWRLAGVKGVKLETVRIGGRRYTSVEALERFTERLSEPRAPRTTGRTPRQRQRDIERAEAQLKAAGI